MPHQMIPMALPARSNMPVMISTCSAVCSAHSEQRSSVIPAGVAGGRGEVRVEPLAQQRFPHHRPAFQIGHDHRDDRALRLCRAQFEAKRLSARLCRVREFSHRCARLFPACISLRIEVAAVATTLGGRLAVKT